MRILLATPPLCQVNTPYPATAYLTGFLQSRAIESSQIDLSLELILALFTKTTIEEMAQSLRLCERSEAISPTPEKTRAIDSTADCSHGSASSPRRKFFLDHAADYAATVDSVIRFLQGKDPALQHRIASRNYLPEGPRFKSLAELDAAMDDGLGWAFGSLGTADLAKHLASLYLDDLADVIRDEFDPRFEFAKYGERLAASAPRFQPLEDAVRAKPTLVDRLLDQLTLAALTAHAPDVLALSVPFPGNMYGAVRIAAIARKHFPQTKIILGGGYVNTELRELSDPAVFDYFDFVTLDDGEGPFLAILEHLKNPAAPLLRTFVRRDGGVRFETSAALHDIPLAASGTPSYRGLSLDRYLSLCELLNPMHRLWFDGRWNKLTVAHGCYWKKCTFCDTSLDYISRYEPQTAKLLVDRMEKLIAETGQSGFHFVDEAAPPRALAAMAEEIIRRGLVVTWWGNIRFEKTFTQDLTDLLARSGCIAMSGGLEVASDRLLGLMEKGVSVEQVAQVTHHFSRSGILVHAYLMYGFPTQTVQETIDALERVRQLFQSGCIQSAFFHRFSVTAHSPVGKNPAKYGVTLYPEPSTFARNDIPFLDATGIDHSVFQAGLKKALYNYMHGACFEQDVREWFDFPVPKPRVSPQFIQKVVYER